MAAEKVIIMGAAGRDFHNFNTYFRDNPKYDVIAFTATQIPGIGGRKYPTELAGKMYPKGIPIFDEEKMPELVRKNGISQVILAYSDLSHAEVMNKASAVIASGADFRLMGPNTTMLESKKPVISVCAVRTGAGKSQTTRYICSILKELGKKVVAIRHPMPYGDLREQVCQRFATIEDLKKNKCTIEEMEEYEPHINEGTIVYAGVDYGVILRRAEKEADVIVWDGGNNDFSFYRPDLNIVVADPHRPGHELSYYPGAINTRMADIVIINKVDTAVRDNVETVVKNVESVNPKAEIIETNSAISVEDPEVIGGKTVLVVEDGPTLTHGGMKYGAGMVAARKYGAAKIVDPRPWAVGSIKGAFDKYGHIEEILPAMGYSPKQMSELQETINSVDCDAVVIGTPIDLRRIIKIDKPAVRVLYRLEEIGPKHVLKQAIIRFARQHK